MTAIALKVLWLAERDHTQIHFKYIEFDNNVIAIRLFNCQNKLYNKYTPTLSVPDCQS